MSIADFDAIIIKRKTNTKKKKIRAGLNDLDKEMKDMGTLSNTIQQVEKTGNQISLRLKVNLADGKVLNYEVQDTIKVQELIEMIKKDLEISINIFYLCEMKEGTQQIMKFYENNRTIFQQKINESSYLGFRLQWICPFTPKQKQLTENENNYLFECLKLNMINEPFPIERKIAQTLGGLLMNVYHGPYEEGEENSIKIEEYINQLVLDNYGKENMKRSTIQVHQKLKNRPDIYQMKISFIQMSQRAHSYGATMFDSFLSGKKVKVGVVYDGIIVYLSDLIEDIMFYPISSFKQIYASNDSCVIYFNNSDKNLQIKTGKIDKLTQLLSGYFYLAKLSSPDVERPQTLGICEKDELYDCSILRKEVMFLTNRLQYFFENIQLAAQDASLEEFAPIKVSAAVKNAVKNEENLPIVNYASSNVSLAQFTVFGESIDRTFKSRGGKEVKETLNVQEINLADNMDLGKTLDFSKALVLVLKSPIALKRIDLSNINLNDEAAKPLVDGFRGCNSLEYLNLANNKDLSGPVVQQMLKSINRNALNRLDIRGIKLTKNDAAGVIRVISDFAKLQSLIIKNNEIGVSGTEFANLAKKCKQLTVLDVRNCQLSKEIVISIMKGFGDNRVLKELRLSGNDGMSSVIDYLMDITDPEKKLKFPPISRLDIASPDLSAGDIKKLTKLLQHPAINISAIDISGAKLKNDIAKLFDTLLSHEKNPRHVKQLCVNDCQVADTAAPNMVNYLSNTQQLTKFKVGYNSSLFRKGNYSCIAELIRGNSTLLNLHISGLNLPPEQIDAIFDAVVNHPSLRKLTLDYNPTGSYMDKISQLMQMTQKLTTIRLRKLEAITKDELIDWLNNDLPQVTTVTKLCLGGNKLVTSDIVKATQDHPNIHFQLV